MKQLHLLCYFFYLPFFMYGQDAPIKDPGEFPLEMVWFDSLVGLENSGLINGTSDYQIYYPGSGHRFFQENEWHSGQLKYEGQLYAAQNLKFDLVHNNVMLNYLTPKGKATSVVLHSEKIEWLKISGHYFQKLPLSDQQADKNKEALYHVLYNGKALHLLAIRSKTVLSNLKSGSIKHDFFPNDQYFLFHNDQLIDMSRKRDFYKLMPDDKKEIRQFIRKNNLRVKKYSDQDLIRLTQFCDELIKKKT